MSYTFTVVLLDGTEVSGLTYEESVEVMAESEKTDNSWARVFLDNTDFKPV